MEYKFFTKDGDYTFLELSSPTFKEEAVQLIEQGFIEQAEIVPADSPEEAEKLFKAEHQGFFKKLNMLLGPFITPGYHR